MYYEKRNENRRDKFIEFIFLIVIVSLLCILIIKLDDKQYNINPVSDYDVKLLSTNNEENVEKSIKDINGIIKCVVGVSKIKKGNKAVFLENANEKLGMGSGIILTESGYILSNFHVAGNKYSNCFITLENGKIYDGTVVWSDYNIDLAIIKIDAIGLDYMVLGDSDNIKLAEEVYAIGNPIGLEFQRTITKGIISGINRTIKIDEENYMEDLIQTDATINEGNSGGPLINLQGELIGVNTVKIENAEGIGFAVPINLIKPILDKLINNGKFEEAYLGIFGYDKEVIPYLESDLIKIDSGVYIASIPTNSPLKNHNVNVGDVIIQIDDIKIDKMNDLKKYIYSKNPKDKVNLKIVRQNLESNIEVELGYK